MTVIQDGVTGEHQYQFMVVDVSDVEEGGVYASASPDWYEPQYSGGVEATLTKDDGPPLLYTR